MRNGLKLLWRWVEYLELTLDKNYFNSADNINFKELYLYIYSK